MREASPILETARLTLREFRPDDVDALAKVLSDPETMRFYPAAFDRTGVAEWIERNRRRYGKDGFGLWAMIQKSNGELIGDCGFRFAKSWKRLSKSRLDTTCAVTFGGMAWPPKPRRHAATSASTDFHWTA